MCSCCDVTGLARLQNVHSVINEQRLPIAVDVIRVTSLTNFHASLRLIDARTKMRTKNIILDLSTTAALQTVLRQVSLVSANSFLFFHPPLFIQSLSVSIVSTRNVLWTV